MPWINNFDEKFFTQYSYAMACYIHHSSRPTSYHVMALYLATVFQGDTPAVMIFLKQD